MGLSTAERNRRKRERKKREREEERQRRLREEEDKRSAEAAAGANDDDDDRVQVEYVAEPLMMIQQEQQQQEQQVEGGGGLEAAAADLGDALRRFQQRAAAVVVTDDDEQIVTGGNDKLGGDDAAANDADHRGEDEEEDQKAMSKRKLRDMIRPTVSELKRRVRRPDLVQAHDVTAADPEFLIEMKSIPGTVPVPRHWGRKRKYLQGKRGYEKPPFTLPDFIVKTGIAEVRDASAEADADMSAKQKNRARVAPKMGAIDVDYRTLHDAFFKYQTKPAHLTKFGDLYYEGKELEVSTSKIKAGFGGLSDRLREALGMTHPSSPPPWLLNMQRYGPPPSYPALSVPGLNAPLPTPECQYGYHPGGWGKPPIDNYGRPLYGGNPFAPAGSSGADDMEANDTTPIVTNDGKTITKAEWGALPTGDVLGGGGEAEEEEESEEEEEEEESSSAEEMEESDDEQQEGDEGKGVESVIPTPSGLLSKTVVAPVDLRKQSTGDETPLVASPPPKQLYTVIEQKKVGAGQQEGAVFASEVAYVVPPPPGGGGAPPPPAQPTAAAAPVPEGAESVLSKAPGPTTARQKKADEGDEEEDLGKNFKF